MSSNNKREAKFTAMRIFQWQGIYAPEQMWIEVKIKKASKRVENPFKYHLRGRGDLKEMMELMNDGLESRSSRACGTRNYLVSTGNYCRW